MMVYVFIQSQCTPDDHEPVMVISDDVIMKYEMKYIYQIPMYTKY